jgi:hypothetical protein
MQYLLMIPQDARFAAHWRLHEPSSTRCPPVQAQSATVSSSWQVGPPPTSRRTVSRHKSPLVFDETRDNRTRYAVDVAGGGSGSAISRRMLAKRGFAA